MKFEERGCIYGFLFDTLSLSGRGIKEVIYSKALSGKERRKESLCECASGGIYTVCKNLKV